MKHLLLGVLLSLTSILTSAQTYVDLTSTQTISGPKTFSSQLRTGSVIPSTASTSNLGAAGTRWLNIYANYFSGNSGRAVFGNLLNTGTVDFNLGSTDDIIGRFHPTTGNLTLQAPGTAPSIDRGYRLYVNGNSKIAGKINLEGVPVFYNNIAATASNQLDVGDIWRDFNNNLYYYTPPVIFTKLASGAEIKTLNSTFWKAQTPNEAWSFQTSTNLLNTTIFRSEIRSGDHWSGDGSQNTSKERSEVYLQSAAQPFNTDVWISMSIRIAPGASLQYTAPASCFIFQMHATEDSGDDAVGPVLNFNLVGDDVVTITTASDNNAIQTNADSPNRIIRGTTRMERGKWHHIVMKVKFTKGISTGGELQMWQNGQELFHHFNVPIGYNDSLGPYPKFGVYRTAMPETTIVEYANVYVGTTGQFNKVASPIDID